MTMKKIATLAVLSVITLTAVSEAHAYKLIRWDDGTWSGECRDGHRWRIGDGTTQPTESQAEAICAKHNGLVIGVDPTSGSGNPTPLQHKAAPAIIAR